MYISQKDATNQPQTTLQVFNKANKWQEKAKYTFDRKLIFRHHIQTQIGKASDKLAELKCLPRNQHMSDKTKTIIHPILSNAMPA